MSVHVEWAGADMTAVSVVAPGTEVGDGTVDDGGIAVMFEADTVFVLEGTPERLRDLLVTALVGIDQTPAEP